MTHLIIVESPKKARTIQKILGAGGQYEVMASRGHIRDLPKNDLGVTPPNFTPTYQIDPTKSGLIATMRAAAKKATKVFLATDPDREGEAISWDLAQVLNIKPDHRIAFNEITAPAIKKALASPKPVDTNLVLAQQTRRVADRLIGYLLTDAINNATAERLSAGRVQTVAVILVHERAMAIRDFKQTLHYGVTLTFDGQPDWTASWNTAPYLDKNTDQKYITERELAELIATIKNLTVLKVEDGQDLVKPPPSFTTPSMQQAASIKYGFNPDKTMKLAQSLFEEGKITYHRTDQPNISDEGFENIKAALASEKKPHVTTKRTWPVKTVAQIGHEAIRPTDALVTDTGLADPEQKLYTLIRNRALASQMPDAEYKTRKITLEADQEIRGTKPVFIGKSRTLITPGWKSLTKTDETSETEEENNKNVVPNLPSGTHLSPKNNQITDHKTTPPTPYTLASLVGELERKDVGRPSTYATITTKILDNDYVSKDSKNKLDIRPRGETIVRKLYRTTEFVEPLYTRDFEKRLDKISEGKHSFKEEITKIWSQLKTDISKIQPDPDAQKECPSCGSPMRKRSSSSGTFWGCSNYPTCKKTIPITSNRVSKITPGQKASSSAKKGKKTSTPPKSATLNFFTVPDGQSTRASAIGLKSTPNPRIFTTTNSATATLAKKFFKQASGPE